MNRILGAVIALIIGFATFALANTAPVKSVGKTIQPLDNVPVRMVSEEVRISLYGTTAWVNCLFTLLNEGAPDTIEVGFPRGWEGDLKDFMASDAHKPGDLKVETLAENPNYNEYTGEKLPWWKVFKVPFDSTGQTIVVETMYTTELTNTGGFVLNDLHFTYIMKTGALWKGNIEDARVTVTVAGGAGDRLTSISPEGYTREGDRITWHFQNFKPDSNIEIGVMQDILYDRLLIARNMLKKEPGNSYAHFLLGTVYFNRQFMGDSNIGEAEKEFREAVSLDPGNLDARWFLANLLEIEQERHHTKELKGIRENLEKILEIDPGYRCKEYTFLLDTSGIYTTDSAKQLLDILIRDNWK
jgi:tetratricopeptide (TPR) repeat protein